MSRYYRRHVVGTVELYGLGLGLVVIMGIAAYFLHTWYNELLVLGDMLP